MKINEETRTTILKACRSGVDQWTAGNSPEIILDALDNLSEESKLELVLRYIPLDHVLMKLYVDKRSGPQPLAEKLRDYTPTMEPRGM